MDNKNSSSYSRGSSHNGYSSSYNYSSHNIMNEKEIPNVDNPEPDSYNIDPK